MAHALQRSLKAAINASLAPTGLRLTRGHDWGDTANFIPFHETMAAARQAGLPVGDYVDAVMNGVPGSSQATIDRMASLGVFDTPLRTVVEIGPGTGRYLEKTLRAGRVERYEIYETADDWARYLVREHHVVAQPTDGYSMAATPSGSADLVHAHKVFDGVPFMVTCCYWHEIVRVVRPGGWAVFDIIDESCLDDDHLSRWGSSGIRNGAYPAVVPREVAMGFFTDRGFRLAGSSIVPIPPGTAELLVFRRADAP